MQKRKTGGICTPSQPLHSLSLLGLFYTKTYMISVIIEAEEAEDRKLSKIHNKWKEEGRNFAFPVLKGRAAEEETTRIIGKYRDT